MDLPFSGRVVSAIVCLAYGDLVSRSKHPSIDHDATNGGDAGYTVAEVGSFFFYPSWLTVYDSARKLLCVVAPRFVCGRLEEPDDLDEKPAAAPLQDICFVICLYVCDSYPRVIIFFPSMSFCSGCNPCD